MDAYNCIITRRSIRKYKNDKIDNETINLLLKAASHAPTANNYQEWHFLVITENKILIGLSKIHPHGIMLANAQIAILICADNNVQPIEGYQAIDCAAATQNILLASHSLGLGAVWLGIYPREERIKLIKNFFNLPENINPISLISIGYPNEEKRPKERILKEKVHYNKW